MHFRSNLWLGCPQTRTAKAVSGLHKVVRKGDLHELFEFNVRITLGGDFAAVYTAGDNRKCIPTDTMKNTVYALAKKHAFDSPEVYATLLTGHFLETFAHVTWAQVEIEQTAWARIPVGGKPP